MKVGLAWRCALAVLAVVAAPPASAFGAVTLGARDVINDTNADGCVAPCTYWLRDAAPGRQSQAPFDGVVVRWRLRISYLGASGGSARLRVLRRTSGLITNRVTALRSGPSFPLDVGLNEFADRVPIGAGETVGFDAPVVGPTPQRVDVFGRIVAGASIGQSQPPLADGVAQAEGPRSQNTELLFNAVVEPDADGDGFGDESQDDCATDPAVQGACPGPPPGSPTADRTSPDFLGAVAVRPRRLLPGGGASFIFALSEPARVTVALERRLRGRRVRGRCVRATRRNRGRPRCRRFIRAGVLTTQGQARNNLLTWAGRVRGRLLAPASYRAVFQAVDESGNRAAPRRAGFTVRRLPRRPR